MNCRYFFCAACKVFVDAGYRWAYWGLEEPEIVKLGQSVNADLVFAAPEYWEPERGTQSKWLIDEVLPSVRHFLNTHGAHGVVYGDEDRSLGSGSGGFLEWIQEGYRAQLFPRFFDERLESKPFWWSDPGEREIAERWFQARLIRRFSERPGAQ